MLTVHLLEDLAPEEHKHVSEDALTHPDSTSVQPLIRGDWVLFHPVDSQEELRSVEVSLEIFDSFFGLSSNLPFRRLGGARELILTDILIYLGPAPSSQNVLR